MEDAPVSRPKGSSKWKRPPTKVYDYNYDVGERGYRNMIAHLDKKSAGLSVEPPGPKTFAERLAEDPIYSRKKPLEKVLVSPLNRNQLKQLFSNQFLQLI